MSCQEHNYVYAGIRFKDTGKKLPGSGATYIEYYDFYYCSKCLEPYAKKLSETSNSYQDLKFNATPLE